MRCPYCNALNAERATFCAHCGRGLTPSVPTAQSAQQSSSTRPTQSYTQQPPSHYPQRTPAQSTAPAQPVYPAQPQPARPTQSRPPTSSPTQTTRTTSTTRAPEPVKTPGVPDPPAPFPPRTMDQLQALEQGAISYTVVDEAVSNGRKRTVRISYRACPAWQQVATLLKAFKEQQSDNFDTIIIQGVVTNTAIPYAFNNGQFRFDHNVRLGSQFINRYIIETGTGLESNSLRIVLQDAGVQ